MQAPAILPPAPRVVRLKRSAWVKRILLWLLLLAIFGVAPFYMSQSMGRVRTLVSSGKTLSAKVVDSYLVNRDSSTHYYLKVSFTVDGKEFAGDREVSQSAYLADKAQATVLVVTMPNDPNDFEIGPLSEATVSNLQKGWIGFLFWFGLFAIGFLVWFEVALRKERQLLTRGEAVMGQVVDLKVNKGEAVSTTVQYRYSTQFGERVGRRGANGNLGAKFPKGSAILVVYSKENDQKSVPALMFRLVTL